MGARQRRPTLGLLVIILSLQMTRSSESDMPYCGNPNNDPGSIERAITLKPDHPFGERSRDQTVRRLCSTKRDAYPIASKRNGNMLMLRTE